MKNRTKTFILTLITVITTLFKSTLGDQVIRFYNLGIIYHLERKVLETEFQFLTQATNYFDTWKSYSQALTSKALNSVTNAVVQPDIVIESTAVQIDENTAYTFLLGWKYSSPGRVQTATLYVVDA